MHEPCDTMSFYDLLRQQVRSRLERARRADDCAKLLCGLHQVLEAQLHRLDRSHLDCAPGCGSCCRINVAVLMPEAGAVMEYLQRQLPPGERQELAERVAGLYRQVGGLDEAGRLQRQLACAFLDGQGNCRIYPVRPLMCRSVTSTDAAACVAALGVHDPDLAPPVVMHLEQKQFCDAAFLALADAVAELGLDDRSTTLTTAVHNLLRQPTILSDWLAGGPVPRA